MYIWSFSLGLSIFEEWNKIFCGFAEYILFALYEGLYCWIVDGGVKNLWDNILILKFIIPQISYSVLIKI